MKFTLAMQPVKKGDLIGEVVRDLLADACEHVSISTVYADSEFCSVSAIHALEEARARYIIPSPKNKRVKREIRRMNNDVEVKPEYGIYGEAIDGPSNARAETTLVLVPSTKDPEKTVAFVTNKDVEGGSDVERRYAKGLIDRYGRR